MNQQSRSYASLVILLGVLFLLSPYAMSGVTLGAQTQHYSVGYIETTADGYNFTGGTYGSLDKDILCWGTLSRACQLERSLLKENVSIEYGSRYYSRAADYDYIYHNGSFYEAAISENSLWLRAMNATTVFQNTASDGSNIPAEVMNALQERQQEVATHAVLPTHQLITIEEGHYATLVEDRQKRGVLDRFLHAVEPFLGPLGFLLGLSLVLQGQRWRVQS